MSSRGIIGTMLPGEEFRCALCRGKGVLPSGKARCPACGGRGFVKLTPPAITCAYCNGRGEVPARSNIACTVCGGKGMVSIQQPAKTCQECRGTGAASGSKLPCLVCRGKGVVVAEKQGVTMTKAGTDDLDWVAIRARKPMGDEMKTVRSPTEGSDIYTQAEPSLVSILRYEVDGGRGADYLSQPQHRKETGTGSPASVAGLVRRLIAAERARLLGGKAVDLGRYALEKRTQHWRESRKPLK